MYLYSWEPNEEAIILAYRVLHNGTKLYMVELGRNSVDLQWLGGAWHAKYWLVFLGQFGRPSFGCMY